ncbi:hypothetical protein J7E62_09375 [Variovorax paradoxus]|nr:hypothetical protein [Variovorax paradoxus]
MSAPAAVLVVIAALLCGGAFLDHLEARTPPKPAHFICTQGADSAPTKPHYVCEPPAPAR